MKGRRSLHELVQDAGVAPVQVRAPCLPAPSQPAISASEEDHLQARNLLVDQRRNNPEYKEPGKQLKRIFRSSKEREKLQDPGQWEFSQDELDQALSTVVDKPTTSPGLIQAFLNLGAKVNYVETQDQKKNKGGNKPNSSLRRRSTVLQKAATVRRADSVGLLASSGADQTTLDEGLRAALAASDHSCTQELLRHGADINKFPNALADAVRSNDQNLVRLLLRAPKALRTEVISSCLPAAVQQRSEEIVSLLIGYGADPNFNEASALHMAVSLKEYRMTVALVAGPIMLRPLSLQTLVQPCLKMPTAHELHQFLELLLCCGLSPASPGLDGLLIAATQRNDTPLARLLIDSGVSTATNESECLRSAISNGNWELVESILGTSISPASASVALAVIPTDAPQSQRYRIIQSLVQKGASGPPLGRWLIHAVEEGEFPLMDLLLNAGASLESGNSRPLHAAVARKEMQSLRTLLNARPSAESLAQVFPLMRTGYTPAERLQTSRLLLEHGARGSDVDQALVDAISDTSHTRDLALITEFVRNGANVNYDNGKAISLAVRQADMSIIHLLCASHPSKHVTSQTLPLAFDEDGGRHSSTLEIIDLLLANGSEEAPAKQVLQTAVKGGHIDIIHRLIAAEPGLVGVAFQYAIGLESSRRKAPILTPLLRIGVPKKALDEALVAETQHAVASNDTTILAILLEHGASVNHNNGEAFSQGVASGNSMIVKSLLHGREKPSEASVTKAFRALFQDLSEHDNTLGSRFKGSIASELLSRGVQQAAIDAALRATLDPENYDNNIDEMVDLLLRHNANVNTADAMCFVHAGKRGDFANFDKLLRHNPDYRTLLPSLINSKLEEGALVKLLQSCYNHGCSSDEVEARSYYNKPSLILAIQEYPRSETLIRLLLDNGCNPNITVRAVIEPSVGEETISALVWALAQEQKLISSSVIISLLNAGASPTRPAPISEIAPIALAAREGRQDIVQALLTRGADASVRDKWNRSALFYASSTSVAPIVEALSAHALKDDGSLHEAAKNLQLEVARILVKHGHRPNFPCRLHNGRSALGELCLYADVTNGAQRSKARQLIRLFLDNGANAQFKARNEKSTVLLALDNVHSALEVVEALLETEVWENLNDEKHMFRDSTGLWYSPLKYVELVPSPSRAPHKQDLLDLLRDKACEPKYYSEGAEQPEGAIGMPAPIARLADRQKEHELSLKLAKEASEHARMLEETTHRDLLRRKQEQQESDLALQATAQSKQQALAQKTHEFEMQRVRSAERMKRSEKVAWHSLAVEQERDFAAQRQQNEDRKASANYAHEVQLIEQRKAEMEHRANVERKALLEKEQLYDRNVKRQRELTARLDESAQLHAKLRQDRPAIEGPPQWGSVD